MLPIRQSRKGFTHTQNCDFILFYSSGLAFGADIIINFVYCLLEAFVCILMYSYVNRMYPFVLVCYPYVTRMLLVCIRMYPYVTRMYPYVSYVTRLLPVCYS